MRSRRVTISAASTLAALTTGSAVIVSMSAGSAQATETGTDGLISTSTYPNITMENADGSALRTISPPQNGYAEAARSVAWSSDGSEAVWVNMAGACGLYISAPDLSSDVGVSGSNYTGCYGEEPIWFDSNTEIVYSSPPAQGDFSTRQLYEAPVVAAGGPAGPLFSTDTGFNDNHPRAVGDLIAFTRTPRTGTDLAPQVWIYDKAAGSAHLAVANAHDADISPDGKTLVFTRPGSKDLFTSAIDGSGPAQLTTDGATVDHQTPAWSPSGTKIAFFNGTHSAVLDVASGDETELPGSGSEPAWQPINASAPKPPTQPSTSPTTPPSTTPTTPPPTSPPSTTPSTAPSTTPSNPPSTPPSTPAPTSPPPVNPGPHIPLVQRVAGGDRFDTGVKTSRLLWPSATTNATLHASAVVLATGASFPDALAGGPLAAAAQGPLLLTDPKSLTPETFGEIQRVLSTNGTVYVLGGSSAISPAVADQLVRAGYQVTRLGGADRFETSRLIADEVQRLAPTPNGERALAVVATGRNFADALSAGPLAALIGAPIVLSDGPHLDTATGDYLAMKLVLPVGGPAYQAVGRTPRSGNPCGDLAGPDRYSTSGAVATCITAIRTSAGMRASLFTGVATGTNYADALTGGALMGVFGDPLLLTAPTTLSAPTANVLAAEKQTVGIVEIFGGANAVSATVERSVLAVLGGRSLAPMATAGNAGLRGAMAHQALGFSTRPNAARAAAGTVKAPRCG